MVSIFAVLENMLGLQPRRSGAGVVKYRCPFHLDRNPSLVASARTNRCKCMGGCTINGREWADAADVVMHCFGMTFPEALKRLGEMPDRPVYIPPTVPPADLPLRTLDYYARHLPNALPYFHFRQVSEQYCRTYRLGASPTYQARETVTFTAGPLAGTTMRLLPCQRFAIPTIDLPLKVQSIAFRLDEAQARERMKALPLKVMDSLKATLGRDDERALMYGLFGDRYRTRGHTGIFQRWTLAEHSDVAFVLEGQINAINLWESTGLPAIASHGHPDLPALMEKFERVIVVRDNDGPGRTLAHNVARQIGRSDVEFVDPFDGFNDVNEMKIAGVLPDWLHSTGVLNNP